MLDDTNKKYNQYIKDIKDFIDANNQLLITTNLLLKNMHQNKKTNDITMLKNKLENAVCYLSLIEL